MQDKKQYYKPGCIPLKGIHRKTKVQKEMVTDQKEITVLNI